MFEISIRSVSGFVPPFFTKIKSNDVKVELLPKADEIKSSLYSLGNIIEDSFVTTQHPYRKLLVNKA